MSTILSTIIAVLDAIVMYGGMVIDLVKEILTFIPKQTSNTLKIMHGGYGQKDIKKVKKSKNRKST